MEDSSHDTAAYDGTQRWYDRDGRRHRDDDLPAVIWSGSDFPVCTTFFGCKSWYQHGKCHREGNLPALVFSNGDQMWYTHGVCTRRRLVTDFQLSSERFAFVRRVIRKCVQRDKHGDAGHGIREDIIISVALFV